MVANNVLEFNGGKSFISRTVTIQLPVLSLLLGLLIPKTKEYYIV